MMTQEREKLQKARRPGEKSTWGHRLTAAALSIPLMATAGWLGRSARRAPHDPSLPLALSGERRDIATPDGRVAYYVAGPLGGTGPEKPPLLLIHSVNAAASAYEVRPIYERARRDRTVYAMELPGYGFSDRPKRLYTPRIMTDAVLGIVEEIKGRHGGRALDVLALSLSSEFLARAASERPDDFRSLALISPTGFDRRGPRNGPPGSNRGMRTLYNVFTVKAWRRGFFDLLASRVSIRYFLEKTWGSKAIDEGLLDYDYRTAHQPGAEHAPYSFISGFLFSNDSGRLYDSLAMPVWMAHGVRGDFTDYSGAARIAGRSNWTRDVFDTGALPHFEVPDDFLARYETFLAAHAP